MPITKSDIKNMFKTDTKRVSVSQYTKNLGKSVVFFTIETLKNNEANGISNFIETNKDFFKDTYASVKNFRSNLKKNNVDIKQGKLFQAVEIGVKNVMEDIKTGQFYDHREDLGQQAIGMSFDDDDDYNDFSSWDDDDSSSSSSSSVGKQITDGFAKVMADSTTANSTVVAKGINLVVKGQEASTKHLMIKMDRIGQNIHAGLGSLYTQLYSMNKMMETNLTAHMQNSKTYYETSIKLMSEQHQMMHEMLEMQKKIYGPKNKNSRYESEYNKVFGSSFDIREYIEVVKNNIKNSMMGMGSIDMGDDTNPYLLLAANPFSIFMPDLISNLLPKKFKNSIKSLDKSVTNLFSQGLARMRKAGANTTNPVLEFLFDILNVGIDKKESISTRNYEKGAVPFDGIVRKSIVEVIPGYLARIESALTGGPNRHYNYDKGLWQNANQIKKDFDYESSSIIAAANYDFKQEIDNYADMVSKTNKGKANKIRKAGKSMIERIYKDGGDFNKRRKDAHNYYGGGYLSEEDYDNLVSMISKDTLKELANANIQATQNVAARMRSIENNPDSIYHKLWNDYYRTDEKFTGKLGDPNKYKIDSPSWIANNRDGNGNNIFDYLRDIIATIKNKSIGGIRERKTSSRSTARNKEATSSSSSVSKEGSSESDDDPDLDDNGLAIPWDQFEKERIEKKRQEEEDEKTSSKLRKWIKDKLGNSPFGKLVSKTVGFAANLLEGPLDIASNILDKVDNNITSLIFGEKELVDKNGNPVKNVFEYIIVKIQESFTDLGNWIKDKFTKNIWDPLKEYFKPRWDEYGRPMVDSAKDLFKSAGSRVRTGLDNTFGAGFRSIKEKLSRGKTVSADEVEDSANNENITTSAYGRYVTKRGLTMISPGEIIIPASFDKKEQNKMLNLEKRDRSRILKAIGHNSNIGLNAEGNIQAYKNKLEEIFGENSEKITKAGGAGIFGGVAGLLTGFNPILGAAAGAGISLLSSSESVKSFLLGKDLGDGSREEGLIPKELQDKFKKVSPDLTDFGIAGGLVGLFTPFGVLGGAAVGAGLGLLKNSKGFNKLLYGDENEEGILGNSETKEKVNAFLKRALPNASIGAIAGVITGPFGLVGNAALGASVGMLSSTNTVHKLLFGADGSEDDEIFEEGLVGAVKNGLLLPAKNKLSELGKSFKDSITQNVINPLKDFWSPFKQTLKNAIEDIGEAGKAFFKQSLDDMIGSPFGDLLQERVFKPITKVVGNVAKIPLSAAKTVAYAPFKVIGGIGKHMQRGLIRKGRANNMTAQERIEWLKENPSWNVFKDTKYAKRDEFIANMSDDDLSQLVDNFSARENNMEQLEKASKKSKVALNEKTFSYLKSNFGYDRISNKKMADISKDLQAGNYSKAMKALYDSGISDDERNKFFNAISKEMSDNDISISNLKSASKDKKEADADIRKLLGEHYLTNGDPENSKLFKTLRSELSRRGVKSSDFKNAEKEAAEYADPEVKATHEYRKGVKENLDDIKKYFEKLLGIEEESKEIQEETQESTEQAVENAAKKANQSPIPYYDPETGLTATGNPNAVEDSKIRAEDKADDETQEGIHFELKRSTLLLNKIKDTFLGKDRDEDDNILTKILKSVKSTTKFLLGGVGVIGGISLVGHLSEWFKNNVYPGLKNVMIGTEEKPGLFYRLVDWFGEKFNNIKAWFDDNGGLSGVLGKYLIEPTIAGLGYSLENIIAPLISGLIKHLPSIIWGIGKGIVKGIFSFRDNNKIDDGDAEYNNAALKEFADNHSKTNAKLEKLVPDSVKSALGTNISTTMPSLVGPSGKPLRPSDRGIDHIKENQNSPKWKISPNDKAYVVDSDITDEEIKKETYNKNLWNLWGLLGETRNNKVLYDENGNRVSDYVQYKDNNNILGMFADSGKRQFIKSLLGGNKHLTSIGLANVMREVSPMKNIKRLKLGKTGKPLTLNNIFNTGAAVGKGIIKGTGEAATAGHRIGKYINHGIGEIFKKALDPDYVMDFNVDTNIKDPEFITKIKDFFAKNPDAAKDVVDATDTAKDVKKSGNIFSRILNIFKKSDDIKDAADTADAVKDAKKGAGVLSKIEGLLRKSEKASKGIDTVKDLVKTGISKVKQVGEFGKSIPTKVINGLKQGLEWLFGKLANNKIFKSFAEKAAKAAGKFFDSKFFKNLMEKLTKLSGELIEKGLKQGLKQGVKRTPKLAAQVAAKLGYVVAGIGVAVDIAFALYDFNYGWKNAATLFGIADNDPGFVITDFHRFLAGLANMIDEFLLGLIPKTWVTAWLADVVLPFWGVDRKDIDDAQNRAKDLLDEYNADHPDNTVGSLEEYNKKTGNQKGILARIGDWISNNTKKKYSAASKVNVSVSDNDNSTTSGGFNRTPLSGGARKSAKQKSVYGSMPYGNSTIGETGCAPVSIVNLLQNMGMKANIPDAALYAIQNGYVLPDGSTDINYFNSYLSKVGVPSYTSTNKNNIYDAIRSGRKVILLGKDNNNGAGSPYGSNPHYITATGVDANGNIIVEDPGIAQNIVKYSKNRLLKSTIASVIAGGAKDTSSTDETESSEETTEKKEGFFSKLGSSLTNWINSISKIIYGDRFEAMNAATNYQKDESKPSSSGILEKAYADQPIANISESTIGVSNTKSNSSIKTFNEIPGNATGAIIWKMLKGYGYTDEGAAGIMGNLYAESGLLPNNLENKYNNHFGWSDIEYTDRVNAKNYSLNSFKSDKAGYGLAQWTFGSRKEGLYNRTVGSKTNPRRINDIGAQIEYLDYELKNEPSFRNLYSLLTSTKNITNASDTFLEKFENPAVKNYDQRRAYSQNMYNNYAGAGRYNAHSYNPSTAINRSNIRSGAARVDDRNGTINYKIFLESIITILMTIADNTALLSKVIDVLSESSGVAINKEEVKNLAKENTKNARKALSTLLNNAGIGDIGSASNSSIQYIYTNMASIANE